MVKKYGLKMKKKHRDITVNGKKYAWAFTHPDADGDGHGIIKIWKNREVIYDELHETMEPVTPKMIRQLIVEYEE